MRAAARVSLGLLLMVQAGVMAAAVADGSWLMHVPKKETIRVNPFENDTDAVPAGETLYQRNCASCHGVAAQGVNARPALHTARVHDATDGELHWLLTNGNLGRGMPSWSRLPDGQRWQIVRYLHTLMPVP